MGNNYRDPFSINLRALVRDSGQDSPVEFAMRRSQARPLVVRRLYPHRLAEACQHFVGSLLVLRPESFATNTRRLLDEAPIPINAAEAVYLWTTAKENLTRGAECFHSWFHAAFDPRPCRFASPSPPAPSTFALSEMDSAAMKWARAVDGAFERTHSWPPAVRAALLLEGNLAAKWCVANLARCVNASAATLERSFDRVFGLTVQQYQSLLRVRAAVVATRGDHARLEGHLLELGCGSANEVYRPLRRLTGLTLGEIRRLDDDAFQALLSGPLAVPVAGFSTRKPVAGTSRSVTAIALAVQ